MTDAHERAAKLVALYAKRDAPVDWTTPLTWADGRPMGPEELSGFGSVLAALVSPESWRLGSAVRDGLAEADRSRVASAVLELQPASSKRGESWSTYAFGVFASESQLESWLPTQRGRERPVLELVIRMLEARGTPTALRGLEALSRGKARREAEAALDRIAAADEASPDELLDRAFLGVGGRELVARMENAMILGRPLSLGHVRRLVDDPHARIALRDLLLVGDGVRVVVKDALTVLDGAPEPDDRATVLIAHPARDPGGVDEALRPPFPQLDRPFVQRDRATLEAELVAARCTLTPSVEDTLRARGYRPAAFNPDAGCVTEHVRSLGREAAITLHHEGPGGALFAVSCESPFDAADPGLWSEAALDVYALLGR